MLMTTVVWPHRENPLLGMMQSGGLAAGRAVPTKATKLLRVVMAGGGTGGHLYPGLAVADALRARAESMRLELELIWAATPRAVDQRLLSQFGEQYVKQPVQPLVKSVKKLMGFLERVAGELSIFGRRDLGVRRWIVWWRWGVMRRGRRRMWVAKRGIPVVLLNPDALPGLANRFLLKRADVIVTQWPLGANYRKGLKGVVKPLGCPIRPELMDRTREEAAGSLGIDGLKKTLVVTGASLGAKTINDAMLVLLGDSQVRAAFGEEGRWQIVHLAGLEQAEAVRKAYSRWPGLSAKVIDYCDDMASVWAVADLAIARAGASTCAELTACGVPSILMPYPFHKDMHQQANAMELVRAGAAIIVDDVKDAVGNAAAIKTVLGLATV